MDLAAPSPLDIFSWPIEETASSDESHSGNWNLVTQQVGNGVTHKVEVKYLIAIVIRDVSEQWSHTLICYFFIFAYTMQKILIGILQMTLSAVSYAAAITLS